MLGPGNGKAALITPALHSTQVQTFHGDLLQHMEKNTKLDMQFIKVSLATHLSPCPSRANQVIRGPSWAPALGPVF